MKMSTRKTLILISCLIISGLFVFTSIISYNFGVNYGVENAESIRDERANKILNQLLQQKLKINKLQIKFTVLEELFLLIQ